VPGGGREVRVGLEAEVARIRDGAEHQVPGEVDRRRQGRVVGGAEILVDERGELTPVESMGTEGILDAEAVHVDQVAAGVDLLRVLLGGTPVDAVGSY
jgi:hypothetical protein